MLIPQQTGDSLQTAETFHQRHLPPLTDLFKAPCSTQSCLVLSLSNWWLQRFLNCMPLCLFLLHVTYIDLSFVSLYDAKSNLLCWLKSYYSGSWWVDRIRHVALKSSSTCMCIIQVYMYVHNTSALALQKIMYWEILLKWKSLLSEMMPNHYSFFTN